MLKWRFKLAKMAFERFEKFERFERFVKFEGLKSYGYSEGF